MKKKTQHGKSLICLVFFPFQTPIYLYSLYWCNGLQQIQDNQIQMRQQKKKKKKNLPTLENGQ